MKKNINIFLENKITQYFLIALIFLNLFIFIFETDINFYNTNKAFIQYFETFSVVFFSVEYLLRVFALDKFKNIFKPLMIIDLLAILPFYLSFAHFNTIYLRTLRLFRLLRVAKITRYTDALDNIKQAFVRRKNELIITGMILILGLTFSSIFIYYAEHLTGQATFKSIPTSFWWSVMTFTTVGYGDAVPITTLGKFIGSITAIVGVCIHGLLVGIIGTALMEAIQMKSSHKKINELTNQEGILLYEKANN